MAKTPGGETVIARGVRVQGDIAVDGNIIIEGEVQGTLSATGDLHVGEGALLEADIKVENAVVAGNVRGNLRVVQKLELLPSSKFFGDVTAEIISVGAGAQMNGTVHMGAEESAKGGRSRRSSSESDES